MDRKKSSGGLVDTVIKGTGGWLESIGIKPGVAIATFSGIAEILSGILFILGIFLPLGAFLIVLVMLGSIVKVHGPKGFSVTAGGFEYNLFLIVVSVGLAMIGPGGYSLGGFLAPEYLCWLLGTCLQDRYLFIIPLPARLYKCKLH